MSTAEVEAKQLLPKPCVELELGATRLAAALAEELSLAIRIDEFEAVDEVAVVDDDGCHDLRIVANGEEDNFLWVAARKLGPTDLLSTESEASSSLKSALNAITTAESNLAVVDEFVHIIDRDVAVDSAGEDLKAKAL